MTLALQSRTRCLAEKTCRRSSGGWLTCPTVAEFGYASWPNAQMPYGIFFFSSPLRQSPSSLLPSLPNGLVIPGPGSPIGRGGDPPDLLFSARHWPHLVSADKGSLAIGQTPQAPTHPCPGPQAAVSALLCSLFASRTNARTAPDSAVHIHIQSETGLPDLVFHPKIRASPFPSRTTCIGIQSICRHSRGTRFNSLFPQGSLHFTLATTTKGVGTIMLAPYATGARHHRA